MAGRRVKSAGYDKIWVPRNRVAHLVQQLTETGTSYAISEPRGDLVLEVQARMRGLVPKRPGFARTTRVEKLTVPALGAQAWAGARMPGHDFVVIEADRSAVESLRRTGSVRTVKTTTGRVVFTFPDDEPAASSAGVAESQPRDRPAAGQAGQAGPESDPATGSHPAATYRVDPADREAVTLPRSGLRNVMSLGIGVGLGALFWPAMTGEMTLAGLSWSNALAFGTFLLLLVAVDRVTHLVELVIRDVQADRDARATYERIEDLARRRA